MNVPYKSSVKYLGMQIDQSLTQHTPKNTTSQSEKQNLKSKQTVL